MAAMLYVGDYDGWMFCGDYIENDEALAMAEGWATDKTTVCLSVVDDQDQILYMTINGNKGSNVDFEEFFFDLQWQLLHDW